MSGNHDLRPAIPPPSSPINSVAAVQTSVLNYNGFAAGLFSGLAKLAVGHPFDTVKVRLQTAPAWQFAGPLDCVAQTIREEGVWGLYKGTTPPLVGWMLMDSLMLGSLTLYKGMLQEHVFTLPAVRERFSPMLGPSPDKGSLVGAVLPPLPLAGHALAGTLAGWTVAFLAAPVEHVKTRLQVQYSGSKEQRLYRGPVDCVRKIFRTHGVPGLYRGLAATLYFRTFMCVWWASYDRLSRWLENKTALSQPAINFWAGGLSSQIFWLSSYPFDVVKQRIITDPLGGTLGDGMPRFYGRWRPAARDVLMRDGIKGYWRGFVPCIVRAFPANAIALLVFEGVMRGLPR